LADYLALPHELKSPEKDFVAFAFKLPHKGSSEVLFGAEVVI
jgi:hypothetical protein